MGMSRFISVIALCLPARGGELLFPPAIDRAAPVAGVYRLPYRASGKGELAIRCTGSYGRVVEDRKIPVELKDEQQISFLIDATRAVAMKNNLTAHLTLDGVNKKGAPDHKDENAGLTFVARPPGGAWWDYNIIMWQPHSTELAAKLKMLGDRKSVV